VSSRVDPLVFGVMTNTSGTFKSTAVISYNSNRGWFLYSYSGTLPNYHSSYVKTLQIGVWYELNLTVTVDTISATIVRKDTSALQWSINNVKTDTLRGDNKVRLGCKGSDSVYDNYELYDLSIPDNIPPIWSAVPSFKVVEDVPFIYNFSNNVTDPDGEVGALEISSQSPYVSLIDGLELTFVFPNGISLATVPLVLSDGFAQVVADVEFVIEPVNDPPDEFLPDVLEATEDVPYEFNATTFVRDIDNATSDLWFVVDDSFVAASGLLLLATFPEGILTYEVEVGLTDGLLVTYFTQEFSVTPVDDPPVIAPLDPFVAIEDQISIFNLTPYLSDVDTPVLELSVIVRSARCTVVGHELRFSYIRGGINETVLVQVTDGRTMVDADLEVWVEERNDSPIIHPVGQQAFTEDQEGTIELGDFIEDEDTPNENMTLTCEHPAVVDISGLTVTFMFMTWQPEQTVYFNVSDGFLRTEGQFLAQVAEVNDPPFITGIGDLTKPFEIQLDEGSSIDYQISVLDEDDHNFKYALSTLWSGVTVTATGLLRVEAVKGDVGEFEATLLVEDPSAAIDAVDILITVLNVNDPPSVPTILKPSNHTIVDQGVNVSFSVAVNDPDMMFGQVLTVTWLSNISGPFMTLTTEDDLTFLKDDLPLGIHTVTVRVSDGENVREVWTILEVVEPYVPPPPKEEEPFLQTTSGLGLIIGVILAVVVVALVLVMRPRKEEKAEVAPSPPPVKEQEIIMDVVDGSKKYEVTTSSATGPAKDFGPRAPAPVELATPAAIVPDLEDIEIPSSDAQAEREHAIEVREVMRMLTQLPRGLPSSLIDYDLSDLALMITDGPRKDAPDGTPLVEIDGKWYKADHTKTSMFLQEWKEPSQARDLPEDERAEKLAQLEDRLLEGKISEETYERLRKKYEGS
jgi:uncharacterized membrane protein